MASRERLIERPRDLANRVSSLCEAATFKRFLTMPAIAPAKRRGPNHPRFSKFNRTGSRYW